MAIPTKPNEIKLGDLGKQITADKLLEMINNYKGDIPYGTSKVKLTDEVTYDFSTGLVTLDIESKKPSYVYWPEQSTVGTTSTVASHEDMFMWSGGDFTSAFEKFYYDAAKKDFVPITDAMTATSADAVAKSMKDKGPEATLASFRLSRPAGAGAAAAVPAQPPQKAAESSSSASLAGTVGPSPWMPPGGVLVTVQTADGKCAQHVLNTHDFTKTQLREMFAGVMRLLLHKTGVA